MTNRSRKSHCKIAFIVLALVLPGALCVGVPSWWFGRQTIASRELGQKRAELVARGLPIDNQSIAAFRHERLNHKYSDRWMQVLDEIDSDRFAESCVGIPIVGVPEDEQVFVPGEPYKHGDDMRAFLAEWAELRAEIHEITEGNGAIWTEIEFDSLDTLLPYVQTSRTAARLLSLEFQNAVQLVDRDQAFHSLKAMIGLSRSLEEEPILVSQLVGIAISGLALRSLKQALEFNLFDDPQLSQILEELRSLDDFGSRYRLVIVGERAKTQPVFDNPSQLSEPGVENAIGARAIDALASLDSFERAESVDTEDLGRFYLEIQRMDDQFVDQLKQASLLRKMDTVITGLTFPALGAIGTALTRFSMEIRIAKIAIGLRLYQNQHRHWPSSLDQLASGKLSVDLGPVSPIGGKPFGFRILDGAAEIWGFSPERANDTTPDEPVASVPEERREEWAYWHWTLLPLDRR